MATFLLESNTNRLLKPYLCDEQSAVIELLLGGGESRAGLGLGGLQGGSPGDEGFHLGLHLADVETRHRELLLDLVAVARHHLGGRTFNFYIFISYSFQFI